MNFLAKLAEVDPSEQERFQEALESLSDEQRADFERCVAATPRLDKLAMGIATADRMGRELARERGDELAKLSWAMPKAVGGLLQKGTAAALRSPGAAMAAGGAALGAGAGALAGGGVDPATGQRKSRLKGALVGAGLGAGAGYGISKIPMGGNQNVGSALKRQIIGKPAILGERAQQYGREALKAVPAKPVAAAPVAAAKPVTAKPPKVKTPAAPAASAPAAPVVKTPPPGAGQADLAGTGVRMGKKKFASMSPVERMKAAMEKGAGLGDTLRSAGKAIGGVFKKKPIGPGSTLKLKSVAGGHVPTGGSSIDWGKWAPQTS